MRAGMSVQLSLWASEHYSTQQNQTLLDGQISFRGNVELSIKPPFKFLIVIFCLQHLNMEIIDFSLYQDAVAMATVYSQDSHQSSL